VVVFAGLIIFFLGLIVERIIGVTQWPSFLIRKLIHKSSQQSGQTVFALGFKNEIHQESSQTSEGTRIGTSEDAQRPGTPTGPVSRPTIVRDGFILDSISALITDEAIRLQIREDYEQAFSYLANEPKGAATLFTRAFGPVVLAMRGRGDTQDADLLQGGVGRLSQLGIDGTSQDTVSDTATNVHRTLHMYFQNHRP